MKMRSTIASVALMAISAGPVALSCTSTAHAAPTAPSRQLPAAKAKLWYATGTVYLRTGPGKGYRTLGTLKKGYRVGNAGSATRGWQPVNYKGRQAWVSKRYLTTAPVKTSKSKVTPKRAAVTSSARHISMPRGVNGNGYRVAVTVRNNFPQISSIGGYRAGDGGDHGSGRAVDVMIPNYRSNRALGSEIANHLRANASRLGVSYVIWDQKIWSVQRSSEGWRYMSNRGSDNANHKNHVHVSVR
ncbi:SH3 domain-containing protein [Luteococcus sp. H138]|uniref:SH3 domain-containing protein n=1 Tax=unclassified Luteococcus TaxID=2639923 RepID=UPI00313EE083